MKQIPLLLSELDENHQNQLFSWIPSSMRYSRAVHPVGGRRRALELRSPLPVGEPCVARDPSGFGSELGPE